MCVCGGVLGGGGGSAHAGTRGEELHQIPIAEVTCSCEGTVGVELSSISRAVHTHKH